MTSEDHPSTVDASQSHRWLFSPTIRLPEHTSPFRRRGATLADSPVRPFAPPAPYSAPHRHPKGVAELKKRGISINMPIIVY